jgi:NADH-quinone oxidoreductase subunit N
MFSIIALVAGAVLVLCFPTRLARSPVWLMTIGVAALVVAAIPALGAPPLVQIGTLAVVVVAAVAMLLVPGAELHDTGQRPEAAALILLGAGGAIALATASTVLTAAVGLETLSLAAAVLVALGRGSRPLESAFKYFVLASISFACLVYGLALLFMATGSFNWPSARSIDPSTTGMWIAAVVLIAVGFAYKLAVVPLHWGSIDAYATGAPGPVAFVMGASKVAATLALGRLAAEAGMPVEWVLIVVGCISIVWGMFGALAQREIRRMLAYSTVSNAGFMALAIGCGVDGRAAAAFFAVVYALTVALVFAGISGRGTEPIGMDDVSHEPLGKLRAVAIGLALLSLSGVPPLPGFWAKLAVLQASWAATGWIPTIIATIGGVAGVLYYLRPLPDLWAAARVAGLRLGPSPAPAVVVAGIAVVILAIVPGVAYAVARLAAGG